MFESQAVHPTGKMSGRFVHAWDPAVVPHYRTIADAVHRHGAKIFGQLTHGGHTSLLRPPAIMWAPSQMPEPSSFHTTKAMDLADIRATVDGFAAAAVNARDGGFDGVEIKVAHDGLLRSFASPFFNHRTDRYGGSFENRLRISVEVVEAIKKAAGDEFPVGVRLCLHEYTPWGYGLDYGLQIAAHLEATGCVDYFNSDAGSFSSFWMEIPPTHGTHGPGGGRAPRGVEPLAGVGSVRDDGTRSARVVQPRREARHRRPGRVGGRIRPGERRAAVLADDPRGLRRAGARWPPRAHA